MYELVHSCRPTTYSSRGWSGRCTNGSGPHEARKMEANLSLGDLQVMCRTLGRMSLWNMEHAIILASWLSTGKIWTRAPVTNPLWKQQFWFVFMLQKLIVSFSKATSLTCRSNYATAATSRATCGLVCATRKARSARCPHCQRLSLVKTMIRICLSHWGTAAALADLCGSSEDSEEEEDSESSSDRGED